MKSAAEINKHQTRDSAGMIQVYVDKIEKEVQRDRSEKRHTRYMGINVDSLTLTERDSLEAELKAAEYITHFGTRFITSTKMSGYVLNIYW